MSTQTQFVFLGLLFLTFINAWCYLLVSEHVDNHVRNGRNGHLSKGVILIGFFGGFPLLWVIGYLIALVSIMKKARSWFGGKTNG